MGWAMYDNVGRHKETLMEVVKKNVFVASVIDP